MTKPRWLKKKKMQGPMSSRSMLINEDVIFMDIFTVLTLIMTKTFLISSIKIKRVHNNIAT